MRKGGFYMPSMFSMSDMFQKIAYCQRLNRAEATFVEDRYETLKRSYFGALCQCDEAERSAIALSETQCQVEAQRMEREYRLALRLDEELEGRRADVSPDTGTKITDREAGLAYKVCIACYYEIQIENMLAAQELPLSSEFLSALSELEAALVHLDSVAKTERSRNSRIWAN